MKRRDFVKYSSLATLPLILKSCDWASSDLEVPIKVFTDIHTGHLVYESINYPKAEAGSVDYLIVGGGIAGLSAAYQLRDKNMLLLELSENLGGTSSSSFHGDIPFCQGAHYDLEYPENYGQEVLSVLKELGVIEYKDWKKSWSFKDKQHIIAPRRKSQCYAYGEIRNEVLPEGSELDSFRKILVPFEGRMIMPTSDIDSDLSYLNDITFYNFLTERMEVSTSFKRGIDYHMLDDWGGTSEQVSALAGIHYFQCRPYEKQVVDLFSPPEGNGYFIDKLAEQVSTEKLKTSHLVKQIKSETGGFSVEVVDVEGKIVQVYKARHVIYAGHKHALKYIMPSQYKLFEANEYAPWLVLNFVLREPLEGLGYWQNEMLVEDETFMGFVDSSLQAGDPDKQILTAYYCLPPSAREDLKNVEANREVITEKTQSYLEQYFNKSLSGRIEAVYIKVMGHAMPIPKPGYLLNDVNENRAFKNLTFAGVDNARLPLFFEARDS